MDDFHLLEMINNMDVDIRSWFESLINPISSIDRVANSVISSNSLQSVVVIWIPSILSSVLITLPVAHLFGVETNNVGFYIPIFIIELMFSALAAFTIHIILKLQKLKSVFTLTFTLYTINVIYLLIATFFTIPGL